MNLAGTAPFLPLASAAANAMLLRRRHDDPGQNDTALEMVNDLVEALAPRILCSSCENLITEPVAGIEMQGRHRHEFMNPQGYQFLIACYQNAKGCQRTGEYTQEHCWFAGYQWCYALCNQCHEHLGWHYFSASHSFFGLICDRLIEKNDQQT